MAEANGGTITPESSPSREAKIWKGKLKGMIGLSYLYSVDSFSFPLTSFFQIDYLLIDRVLGDEGKVYLA